MRDYKKEYREFHGTLEQKRIVPNETMLDEGLWAMAEPRSTMEQRSIISSHYPRVDLMVNPTRGWFPDPLTEKREQNNDLY